MTFKEIIVIAIIIPLAIDIFVAHYNYNLENATITTKPEITLSADLTDKNNPIIYYQVNNITSTDLIYFSLFNISSSGKKLYLVQNKLIKPNNRYSWQTEIQHNQYGTVIKQLSLEAEEEYFKAIVMDKDNNILANAELRI
jgi:uncharacterized membrane protein